ncbi:hypothetical protein MRX96_009798 [Rhipicephalus microplus]
MIITVIRGKTLFWDHELTGGCSGCNVWPHDHSSLRRLRWGDTALLLSREFRQEVVAAQDLAMEAQRQPLPRDLRSRRLFKDPLMSSRRCTRSRRFLTEELSSEVVRLEVILADTVAASDMAVDTPTASVAASVAASLAATVASERAMVVLVTADGGNFQSTVLRIGKYDIIVQTTAS